MSSHTQIKVLDVQLEFGIRGFGRSWPEGCLVTNLDLIKRHPDYFTMTPGLVKALEKRIEETFDVRTRYMAHLPGDLFRSNEETSESLAFKAVNKALNSQEWPASECLAPECLEGCSEESAQKIEAFILGSTTSRRYTGSQASAVLGKFKVSAPAYEIKAGCSNSLASLHLAQSLLRTGYSNVLVSCAETLSKVIDPKNRETWYGLADAGAAVWLDLDARTNRFKLLKSAFSTRGDLVDLFTTQGDLPPRQEALEAGGYFLTGDSSAMRRAAKEYYSALVNHVLPNEEERKKIRWIIPHQVSWSLIKEVLESSHLTSEVIWNSREFGNVGGASVLFSLAYGLERNLFSRGDQIFMMSVGGGLSFAGQVWEYL